MATMLPGHQDTVRRLPQSFTGIPTQRLIPDYHKPLPRLPMPVQYPVGLIPITGGLALEASSAARFRAIG